jgi:hypothetical protein
MRKHTQERITVQRVRIEQIGALLKQRCHSRCCLIGYLRPVNRRLRLDQRPLPDGAWFREIFRVGGAEQT